MSRVALLLLTLATLTTQAIAAETKGYYVGLSAGATSLNSSDSTVEGGTAQGLSYETFTTEITFKTGFNLASSVGYDFGSFRLESEFRYSKNKIDSIYDPVFSPKMVDSEFVAYQSGKAKRTTAGEFTTLSLMLNGFYDFENKTNFTPYLMAGLGISKVAFDDTVNEMDDTVFTYQFGCGIDTPVSERIILGLSYRYLATDDPEFNTRDSPFPPMVAEYESHNVSLNLRYTF